MRGKFQNADWSEYLTHTWKPIVDSPPYDRLCQYINNHIAKRGGISPASVRAFEEKVIGEMKSGEQFYNAYTKSWKGHKWSHWVILANEDESSGLEDNNDDDNDDDSEYEDPSEKKRGKNKKKHKSKKKNKNKNKDKDVTVQTGGKRKKPKNGKFLVLIIFIFYCFHVFMFSCFSCFHVLMVFILYYLNRKIECSSKKGTIKKAKG